ncbi:DUF3422 family protein [Celeribacter indicus]|uniref:Membrane-anchored protein n=1 Tax=Celeribacter indicus TaxID=1208324 RepID=A0A0B5E7C0_9RHOB|nr:DUF3422 domain-containing protein [Celeribacter indicus]AJE48172.1 hypothetical protein P73_3457 [Celeribacter indicus]SDW34368.1 Uncharacterized membrane-anchored protein [Celeribacter indicus]
MPLLEDHPRRYDLANELHARPFPEVPSQARAAYLAVRAAGDAARRDRDLDRAHLLALLDRHGAAHPAPGATHYTGALGKYRLKWESHTEFVTYTIFAEGVADRAFDRGTFDLFPEDWLAAAPGQRITSALIRVESVGEEAEILGRVEQWFDRESLAVARVLDGALVVAADFRIDEAGHMRFALFPAQGCGRRRIGRVVQRLCEIETYKAMSMLGLLQARKVVAELAEIEQELGHLMGRLTGGDGTGAEEVLGEILHLSTRIEKIVTRSNFRFGATGAYEAIVTQRIEALRETRLAGRQLFGEFMMRRFDPAMRTVRAAERQLESLATRAARAANLLRTKVDVARQAQNQKLLESMDRRADLQLRLQETVEGLSVVAISYYALGLAGYLVHPVLGPLGLSKGLALACLTPPVVLAVWLGLRRIRRRHLG